MRIRTGVLLTLCAFATASTVSAQATGSISGTITTASPTTSSITVYDANGRQVATANGPSYTAANLAPGDYYLLAAAQGYVSEFYNDLQCVAADCVPTSSNAVTVTAGGTVTANFSLTAGGRILGTVRRASDATAIGGVTVFLYNAATSFVATTTTALDGTYTFSTLPAGSYFLRIGAPATVQPIGPDYVQELYGGVLCPVLPNGFGCRIASGTPVTVVDGVDTASINFSLDHGARINGQVTFGANGVVGNVTMTAYAAGQPVGAPATTDSAGFYTIQGLAPGTYFVRANPATSGTPNLVELWYNNITIASGLRPTSVTLTAGQAATGINFALTAGGTINGVVTFTDPGVPTGTAQEPPRIEVYNTAGMLVKSKALSGGSPIAYQVDGLPTGNYYVRTTSSARMAALGPSPSVPPPSGLFIDEVYNNVTCVAEDCLPTSGTPVGVTAGQNTNNIDFALTTGGRITGTAPVNSTVEIYDSRGVRLAHRTATAVTGGSYEATGLPSGTYYLLARRNGSTASELYRAMPCDGCAVTFGTPVVVTAGVTASGIDFAGVPSGSIWGQVLDPGSLPLSTIGIELYSSTGALIGTTTTSAWAGQYRFDGLVSGTYFVRTSNTRGYIDKIYNGIACAGCSVTSGTPVAVTQSLITLANFTLSAGTLLGGNVRNDFSAPLPGTAVSVFSSTGTLVAQATADALGTYAVALPAGSYRARTDLKAGYIQKMYNNQPCALGTCDVTTATPITLAATPLTNIDFTLPFCAARTISPTRLANAAVGSAYRQIIGATGSTLPSSRRFSVIGTLPPGLALDTTTGVISGTPTASGMFAFTIGVTDTFGCAGTRDYTLDVPACAFTLASTSTSISTASQSIPVTLTASCGTVTATSNDSWLTISGTTSTEVTIQAAANTGVSPRTGTVAIGPRVFTVYQSGTTNGAPFGSFDTPLNGTNASGSIAVTGWALDDLGVTRVTIYRDPVTGETPGVPVFIGEATLVTGARPDVESLYPALPFANRAGWGYLLLTNMLPGQGNGPFRLLAYADDGTTTTLLGARTFVGNNASAVAPFGAIDTPAQGATISGSAYINFGWALTPQPKLIPFAGFTINVFIDGVSIGTVDQYNLFRSDVSNLFPNLKNSGGPVGYKTLDTTSLTEGVHTIAWVASDDAGQATGIGSRYFTVNNSAWSSLTVGALEEKQQTMFVPPRIAGPDLGRRSASLALLPAVTADENNATSVERRLAVRELERIELDLRPSTDVCDASYTGYLVARGEVRELPIGSTVDAAGRFYWQTAPGFIGTYRLLFVRTACDGSRERIPVTVTIVPR